ncbi:MAG: C2 domain-containing protein [Myxococcota bacterium]
MNTTTRRLLPLLLAVLPTAACRDAPGPTEEALADYAARHAKQAEGEADAPRAATRVRATVLDGADVPDMDDGPGGTDPYVVLEHDGQRFETSVASDDTAPSWGDSFIVVSRPGAALVITLMDEDTTTDERVGVVSRAMPRLAPGEEQTMVVRFGGEGGRVRLHLEGLAAP